MGISVHESDGSRGEAQLVGATTGQVHVGRYLLDVDNAGGSLVSVLPRRQRTAPPPELTEALTPARGPAPAGEDRGLAARADHVIDQASEITDKVSRVVELTRALLEGRALARDVLPDEIDSMLALLKRLAGDGRFADVLRLGRPLCRLLALTLRWVALVESLRMLLHAATALADSRTVAWTQHELGTLHQGAGDVHRARELLHQAQRTRKEIGDQQGLEATEHNLRQLPRAGLAQPHRAAFAIAGAVVLIAVLFGLASNVGGGGSPPTSSASSKTTTSTTTTSNTDSTSTTTTSSSSTSAAATGQATLSPATLAFANQGLKSVNHARPVTLTNSGTTTLQVTDVRIGGANATDFARDDSGCTAAPVKPGASCTVAVTFTPTAVGPRAATLSFIDNATNIPSEVVLSGTGAGIAVAQLDSSGLDFGAPGAGKTSTRSVTISNAGGNVPLDLNISIGGADPTPFSHTDCPTPLPPNQSCTVSVTFSPPDAAPHSGTLEFSDNAPGSPQMVTLSGNTPPQ